MSNTYIKKCYLYGKNLNKRISSLLLSCATFQIQGMKEKEEYVHQDTIKLVDSIYEKQFADNVNRIKKILEHTKEGETIYNNLRDSITDQMSCIAEKKHTVIDITNLHPNTVAQLILAIFERISDSLIKGGFFMALIFSQQLRKRFYK